MSGNRWRCVSEEEVSSLVEPGEAEMRRGKPTLEDYRDSAITFVFGGMLVLALVVGLVGSIGLR